MTDRTTDRTVDVWGPRTPHARGTVWPARVEPARRRVDRGGRRPVGAVGVPAVQQRLRLRHRRQGRPHGRRPRPRHDVVNHGRLGPKGLYGSRPWASCPDRLTRPLVAGRRRAAWRRDWDDGDGPRRGGVASGCSTEKGPLSHGFYTSGQLFLEEYYTLAVIGKAGIGTPHMDGNTRLCTATAAAALKESFGADGQPGSYTDIEHTRRDLPLRPQHGRDADGAVGADPGPDPRATDPPRIVCVDPRTHAGRREAERTGGVHLAPEGGHQPGADERPDPRAVRHGWVDEDWVDAHTLGVDDLARHGRAVHARARSADLRGRRRRRARGGRGSSASPSACCPPCCRASTSPTRRRRPPCR